MFDERSSTARRRSFSSSRVALAAAAWPLSSACSYLATAGANARIVRADAWGTGDGSNARGKIDGREAFEKRPKGERADAGGGGRTELIRALLERDEVVDAHVDVRRRWVASDERSAAGVHPSGRVARCVPFGSGLTALLTTAVTSRV